MSQKIPVPGDTKQLSIGIRQFKIEDVPALFAAVQESAQELRRWMTWCHPHYSLADSTAFITSRAAQWEAGQEYSFVIYSLEQNEFLGSVGLSRVDRVHRFANLGYWVRSGCTGQGIASVAVRQAAEFAFKQLALHRVELIVALGNHPSKRVAEKAGAKLEGVLKRRIVLGAETHDAASYALT